MLCNDWQALVEGLIEAQPNRPNRNRSWYAKHICNLEKLIDPSRLINRTQVQDIPRLTNPTHEISRHTESDNDQSIIIEFESLECFDQVMNPLTFLDSTDIENKLISINTQLLL